jgi:uridine kinase
VSALLEPLARGATARYEVTAWNGRPRPGVTIEPAETVVLEGVTASRDAFRPYLSFAIWIDTPPTVRLARGLERDGDHMRPQWEAWMQAEDDYVARERPDIRADAIVSGAP